MTAGLDEHSPGIGVLRVAAWDRIPGLVHGFFGRHGGASGGPWSSLNLSFNVGDAPESVRANWNRIGATLANVPIARMRQVHGADVVQVDAGECPPTDADGMFADARGIALAILTADCVPILCVAPEAGAVMALHAGWRGTLAGIASVGLAAAHRRLGVPPSAWQVALGPSIGGCCYQVEAHIGGQLVGRWGKMPDAWQPNGSHGQLDLRNANRHILLTHGVPEAQIFSSGPCTACERATYFSHRASGGRAGRQASVIGWAS